MCVAALPVPLFKRVRVSGRIWEDRMRTGVINEVVERSSCVYLQFVPAEQHFTEVVGSEEFLNLGMEQVSSLIASDKLTIPSEEKVRSVVVLILHV